MYKDEFENTIDDNPFTKPIPVHTSPLSEIAAIEPIFPVVHPPVAEIASPIAIGAFVYSNPHVVVSPGPVNLFSLPDGKFLHGVLTLMAHVFFQLFHLHSLETNYHL